MAAMEENTNFHKGLTVMFQVFQFANQCLEYAEQSFLTPNVHVLEVSPSRTWKRKTLNTVRH